MLFILRRQAFCLNCFCFVDEMYVLSASNKHVSIELVGKDKIQDKFSKFEELTSAALPYLGVSSPGANIGTIVTSKLP